jgi:hypothetical protein
MSEGHTSPNERKIVMASLVALEVLLQEAGYPAKRASLFAQVVDDAQIKGMSADDIYSALVLWAQNKYGGVSLLPVNVFHIKRFRKEMAVSLREEMRKVHEREMNQPCLFDDVSFGYADPSVPFSSPV